MPNIDPLTAIVVLAIGCIIPAAVFITMWLTGTLNRDTAGKAMSDLANAADGKAPDLFADLDRMERRYMEWWLGGGR